MAGFEENEISKNANGGTELIKRRLAGRISNELLDNFQIICSRVRDLDESKIRVYWIHDLPEDPELEHLSKKSSRDRFHHFVFCGQWQYYRFQHMLQMPYDQTCSVIDNAIVPFERKPKNFDDGKIRLIYTSTPQRGLDILVPVVAKLAEKYPNIHLDVFSSFKIYGWEGADNPYEKLFDEVRNHPNMTYHGFQPNEVVREYQQNAHIFSYPSTWVECNSISLIEAMSAGLLCVHPNFGGLIDTSGSLTFQYQGSLNKQEHAQMFYQHLEQAIKAVPSTDVQNYLDFIKTYADIRYNMDKISNQWEGFLQGLLKQYPTPESRKIPAPMFSYKVG